MDTKTKISNWLGTLQNKLADTNERQRALDTLNITHSNLLTVRELQERGERAFALKTLGLTNEDLKAFTKFKAEEARPRVERILDLMGEPSNFRKFLIFCFPKYLAYKAKHQNKWKTLREDELIQKIKSNPLKGDDDIFQLILNSFFLYWKRHYSKEAAVR